MYSTAAARANQAKGENNAFNKESRHGRSETDGGTAAFLQLPLSPLIDPKLQAARNRYKARKPEPSREPSEFQKKLAKNPYGAITSPSSHYRTTSTE